MVDDGVIQFPSIFTFVGRAFASVDGLGRDLDPKYDFRALCEPYVGEIISERYQLEARQQRAALFDGVGRQSPEGLLDEPPEMDAKRRVDLELLSKLRAAKRALESLA